MTCRGLSPQRVNERSVSEHAKSQNRRANTFEFLGFTHYCDKTRKGGFKVGRKTSRKKFKAKCKDMNLWFKSVRNLVKTKEWWNILRSKLQGHYQYYGVSGNMPYKTSFFGTTGLKNEEMWSCFLDELKRHYKRDFRFIICGGDQVYSDGVKTLSIWKYLNKKLLKDQNTGKLRPVKEDMLSWYRDIYRGYWGFSALRNVFSSFPAYMIWDDHELGDGWGSYYKNSKKDLCDSSKS
ncbi:MAG: alkaline phosphatase D family protein [Candidatus Scalindua sp.]